MMLSYCAGLRACEIASLRISDVIGSDGEAKHTILLERWQTKGTQRQQDRQGPLRIPVHALDDELSPLQPNFHFSLPKKQRLSGGTNLAEGRVPTHLQVDVIVQGVCENHSN